MNDLPLPSPPWGTASAFISGVQTMYMPQLVSFVIAFVGFAAVWAVLKKLSAG